MAAINSPEHAIHADGFMMAMADRAANYHPDPAPAMRKHPLPAIMLSQEQARLALDWWDSYPACGATIEHWNLVHALELAALGDEPEPQ